MLQCTPVIKKNTCAYITESITNSY